MEGGGGQAGDRETVARDKKQASVWNVQHFNQAQSVDALCRHDPQQIDIDSLYERSTVQLMMPYRRDGESSCHAFTLPLKVNV